MYINRENKVENLKQEQQHLLWVSIVSQLVVGRTEEDRWETRHSHHELQPAYYLFLALFCKLLSLILLER